VPCGFGGGRGGPSLKFVQLFEIIQSFNFVLQSKIRILARLCQGAQLYFAAISQKLLGTDH
jgi:hypothetical protein